MKCSKCHTDVQPHWQICPLCEEELRDACRGCNKILQQGWKICPYCRTKVEAKDNLVSQNNAIERMRKELEHEYSVKLEAMRLEIQQQQAQQEQQELAIEHLRQEYQQEFGIKLEAQRLDIQQQAQETEHLRQQYQHEYDSKLEAERLDIQQQQAQETEHLRQQYQHEYDSKLEAERQEMQKQQYLLTGRIRREIKQEYEANLEARQQKQEKATAEKIKQTAILHSEAKHLPIDDLDFVKIPADNFIMGSPEGEKGRGNNENQHSVHIEEFEIMKTPVTFAQYEMYCQQMNKNIPYDEGWGKADRPVINVSYWDAIGFCEWLTKQTGIAHRLPTEAEWEYACRAGSSSAFSYGNHEDSSKMHNFSEGGTSAVAKFPANNLGLFDMHGNVWEWCSSVWDENYSGKEQLDASSERANNEGRILRGGAWFNSSEFCRSASRYNDIPDSRYNLIGFRIARVSRSIINEKHALAQDRMTLY